MVASLYNGPGQAAVGTLIVNVTEVLVPLTGILVLLLHVTRPPEKLQLQPEPVALTNVAPVGSTASKKTVPLVATAPKLLTFNVYVTLPPTATLEVPEDLLGNKSGTGVAQLMMFVLVVFELDELVSPPPTTLAVFVFVAAGQNAVALIVNSGAVPPAAIEVVRVQVTV